MEAQREKQLNPISPSKEICFWKRLNRQEGNMDLLDVTQRDLQPQTASVPWNLCLQGRWEAAQYEHMLLSR